MTAPATTARAVSLAELLPGVREFAASLGEIPSRNRIMREFKVGAGKARALRAALVGGSAPDAVAVPEADTVPGVESAPDAVAVPESAPVSLAEPTADPVEPMRARRVSIWPVWLIAAPAFVSIWAGWVGLGRMTGFGMVDLLPGIVGPGSWATIDSAITLPIGVEVYAAYALRAWLSGLVPTRARRFAKWSAIGSLTVGALGQIAYHTLTAAGVASAPWWITTLVACLPVAVLGMGAALAHLMRETD